jgi:enamine deaminase RidA (YjgF/YER057c/UK114 family)
MNVYENLKRLNLTLPEAPPPGGLYVPVKQVGNLLYTSGHGPIVGGKPAFTGKLGGRVSIEEGQEAARLCIVNILSNLQKHLGDLNRVKNVVKVLGFVASAPGFNNQPLVINGGSQLLMDIFGESGKHTRSAIGTNELPGDIPVEIEIIFEIDQ